MHVNQSDSELVQQTLEQDNAAYGVLILRYHRRVFAFCKAHVWCQAAAEDLTQDVFIHGLKKLHRLRDREKFCPWLLGITRKLCSRWRKGCENRAGPLPPWGPGANYPGFRRVESHDWLCRLLREAVPEQDLMKRVEAQLGSVHLEVDLMDRVEALPRRLRAVVVLRYLGGLSYAEIADVLGCCKATVGNLLREARKWLRQSPGPDFNS